MPKYLEYQWALITLDSANSAVVDEIHSDTMAELQEWQARHPALPTQQHRIALVRHEFGETVYAFAMYGMLGEFFQTENGTDSFHRIPRNYRRELAYALR